MNLFSQLIDALKFTLVAVILSFVVLIAYSLEKKIISKMRDGKGIQGIGYEEMKLCKPCDTGLWLM